MVLFFHFINQDAPKIVYDPVKRNSERLQQMIDTSPASKSKQGKVMITIYRAILCTTIGELCTDNPTDSNKYYAKSLLGSFANLITLPYSHPPASGVMWAWNGLQNAGFVPKTFAAQGLGLAAISPFQNIWKVFRDIAYMFLVIVLIIIGFMIMFRAKLNPQTVISVESSLPRLVISLILITFSFAIAGFLIDLMYLLIGVSISMLSSGGKLFPAVEFQNKYLNAGFDQIWFSLFPAKSSGLGQLILLAQSLETIIPTALNFMLRNLLGIGGAVVLFMFTDGFIEHIANDIGKLFGGAQGSLIASAGILAPTLEGVVSFLTRVLLVLFLVLPTGFALGFLSLSLIITLLLLVTIFFMLFRIFFLLLSTYIKILIMIIFSPIFMLIEAIPGKNVFTYWLRNIVVELLVFPLIIILFIVAYIIVNTSAAPGAGAVSNQLWQPPFLGSIDPNAFTIVLGFGIVFLIPELIKAFHELLGAKGLPVSLGVGTFFGGAAAAWGGTQTGIGMFSSLTQAPLIGRFLLGNKYVQNLLPKTIGEQVTEALVKNKLIGPQGGGGAGGGQHCLPGDTLIDTPKGNVAIKYLKVGDIVWTDDGLGKTFPNFVINIRRQLVKNHRIMSLRLADGRNLSISPSHPTANYRRIDQLSVGDKFARSIVTHIKKLKYQEKYTYDILPGGPTGTYWANNILIGSTLFKPITKRLGATFLHAQKPVLSPN